MRRLALFALLSLASATARAAGDGGPQKTIHFQGFLRTSAGQIINGNKNLVFSIVDSATPGQGNTLYTQNFYPVNISTGFFDVTMAIDGVDSWPAQVYLKIVDSVTGSPELSPRIPLEASLFTLMTSSAEVVTGRVAVKGTAGPSILRGALGVGTAPATDAPQIDVAGPFELTAGVVPPVSQFGATRLYFEPRTEGGRDDPPSGSSLLKVSENGAAFVPLISPAFVQGGNAIDGAETPAATLGTNDAYGLSLRTNGVERLRIDAAGNIGVATTAPVGLLTVGNGDLTLTAAGRMGIGTSQPTSGVTVVGGDVRLSTSALATPSAIVFWDGSRLETAPAAPTAGSVLGAGDVTIAADADADGNGQVLLRTGMSDQVIISTNGTVSMLGAPTGGGLFRVASALTVLESGRVGIATTSPSGTLDVRGMILEPGSITNVRSIGANTKFYTPAFSLPSLPFKKRLEVLGHSFESSGGSLNFTDTRLGIGTQAPNAALAVHGASTNALYVSADDTGAGGTAHLIVTGAGKVGIGTATPQSSLHVASGYVQIPTRTGSDPPSSDCSTAAHAGRLVSRADGASGSRLWVCLGTSGWISF